MILSPIGLHIRAEGDNDAGVHLYRADGSEIEYDCEYGTSTADKNGLHWSFDATFADGFISTDEIDKVTINGEEYVKGEK